MKKQKYRFSLTRVRSARIKYNTGVNANGEYYDTYEYNSTEPITLSDINSIYFNLSDEFLGHAIQVAVYYNGVLDGINSFFLVTKNNRQFVMNANVSYIFTWQTNTFNPTVNTFFQFETQYTHPVFSKLSIDKSRSSDNFGYSTNLNTDLYFKAGTFDYINNLSYKDALVFKIERFNFVANAYRDYYVSLPFTKSNCTFDYDRRQLTVDFSWFSFKSYLDNRLNDVVNIVKRGYKHSSLDFNIPAMLQVYVDGSETITNIVGGSATEVDINSVETPDDFIGSIIKAYRDSLNPDYSPLWGLLSIEALFARYWANIFNMHPAWTDEKWAADTARIIFLNMYGFKLLGRYAEIKIVGPAQVNSPAGYYYATTSDNNINQPTNNITIFRSDTTDFYIQLDTSTRYLYIKKNDDSITYRSTQPLNTTCLLSPDKIEGTQLVNIANANDRYAVDTHIVHNIFSRILTTKNISFTDNVPIVTVKLREDDFAYLGPAYKYFVYNVNEYSTELYQSMFNGSMVNVHLTKPMSYDNSYVSLAGSTQTQLTDSGLGAKDPNTYYTYKAKQGTPTKQHLIPIGQYFWSGVSFYAVLPYNFLDVISNWYNKVKLNCFITVGDAIIKLIQEVAPNIKFAKTAEYSNILYGQSSLQVVGQDTLVPSPDIYITHISNIQAGVFLFEAQKVELTLKKIFDMLRDAFQIYYYVDDTGKLHLEHISWFYGINKINNIQYNTLTVKDQYTKALIDYGQGKIAAVSDYLYSSIKFTADSEESFELFKPLEIKCLEETCVNLDINEITLGDFKTDIDYMYASSSERTNGLALIIPNAGKSGKEISCTRISGCDIKGLNDYCYNLWPTNYKASSYELLQYYRWNFASLTVDHCSFLPIERARYIEQEIQIPIDEDLDMIKLIQTRFGQGFILSYKVDIDSRYATVKLLHKG